MRLSLSVTLLTLGLSSFSSATLTVITTTSDLASLASAVGGNDVKVSSIIVGERDPHRIEAKPSFMSRTAGANLFIAVGLELEIGYEKPILDGSGNGRVAVGSLGHLYASEFCRILEKPTGTVTRAQGDIHPYGNPHVWLDPGNGRAIAVGIRDRLIKLDPAHRADYEKNLQNFVNRLDTAMFGSSLVSRYGGANLWTMQNEGKLKSKLSTDGTWSSLGGWMAKMAPVAGIPLLSYHRSWSYLANRFGLNIIDQLEPKPGLEPTPGHLASVIQEAMDSHVKGIIQEPFYSTRHATLVASRTNSKVIVLPSCSANTGPDGYIQMFDQIVDRLSKELR